MINLTKINVIIIPFLVLTLLGGIVPAMATEATTLSNESAAQQGSHPGMMPNPPTPGHEMPSGMEMNQDRAQNFTELSNQQAYFRIGAQEGIPFYQWTGNQNHTSMMLKIGQIIEYNDINGDGQFQPNETVFHIQLQGNADWNFTRVAANDTVVVLSFYTENIRISGFENTILNLTNYLNKDSNYLKFDIEITNWPWASSSDRLAFQFSLSANFHDKLARTMHMLRQNEKLPINRTNENGVYLSNAQDKISAFFSSSTSAYASSVNGDIPVTTQVALNGLSHSADIFLNYQYFGNELVHDPVVGVGEEEVSSLASTISQLVQVLISRPGLFFITSILGVIAIGSVILIKRKI
ncbi:MAG: hypothetical protein ACFFD1_09970 [Candidatus Thorarchaeota archaeon]